MHKPIGVPVFFRGTVIKLTTNKLAIQGGQKAVPPQIERAWPPIEQEDVATVINVLNRRVLWGRKGPEALGLQKEFAEYVGAKHALVVNSGTAALHASVVAAGVGLGDEVITPAYGYWAPAVVVVQSGGVPVFVDIDPDTMNIDVGEVEAKVTDRTKALIPVHVHGLCADMDSINEIAARHNLVVIEDAAQAVGSKYKGRNAGVLGDMAAFSLNGTKNLPAGEGGIITTNSDELNERAYDMAMYSGTDKEIPGLNYRNNEMADALCRSFLRRYDKLQDARRKNVEYLNTQLVGIKGVRTPREPEGYEHSWHLYLVRLHPEELGIDMPPWDFRHAVCSALAAEGVDVFRWREMLVPSRKMFGGNPLDYPVATDLLYRSFCVRSIYPSNGLDLMKYIADAFCKVFDNLDEVVGKW